MFHVCLLFIVWVNPNISDFCFLCAPGSTLCPLAEARSQPLAQLPPPHVCCAAGSRVVSQSQVRADMSARHLQQHQAGMSCTRCFAELQGLVSASGLVPVRLGLPEGVSYTEGGNRGSIGKLTASGAARVRCEASCSSSGSAGQSCVSIGTGRYLCGNSQAGCKDESKNNYVQLEVMYVFLFQRFTTGP